MSKVSMAKLRLALVDKGLEASWSCAPMVDKRSYGSFYFIPNEGRIDTLSGNVAADWVEQLCEDAWHKVVGQFRDFKMNRAKKQRLTKVVKFHHPASVQDFENIDPEKVLRSWTTTRFTYEVPQNVSYQPRHYHHHRYLLYRAHHPHR